MREEKRRKRPRFVGKKNKKERTYKEQVLFCVKARQWKRGTIHLQKATKGRDKRKDEKETSIRKKGGKDENEK